MLVSNMDDGLDARDINVLTSGFVLFLEDYVTSHSTIKLIGHN